MKKKLLFIFGTRPEAIKMAPIIMEVRKNGNFDVEICLTGQHREMLDQVMYLFELKADYDIDLMKPNQTLFDITASALLSLREVITRSAPDWILVQGDTTTAYVGALAAYYLKKKIAHIEAGLRSFNKYAPFPEEINRMMISTMADLNFAPTRGAKINLEKENTRGKIYITGNTVIDALFYTVKKTDTVEHYLDYFSFLNPDKKIVLVTCHRRENFGKPLEEICDAILQLSEQFPDVQFVYPVHLNPNVQSVVRQKLSGRENIFLIAPLDYAYLVWIMNRSYFIITDSGGIQEEAPALGKPVLVLREVTERMEGVEAGNAILVGASKEKIQSNARRLLEDPQHYHQMSNSVNPYGDGTSAAQIVSLLTNES